MKKHLPNFLEIFEGKLGKLTNRIKVELDLPKHKRSRHSLKLWLKEAKLLKTKVQEVRNEHAATCPHCGKKI